MHPAEVGQAAATATPAAAHMQRAVDTPSTGNAALRKSAVSSQLATALLRMSFCSLCHSSSRSVLVRSGSRATRFYVAGLQSVHVATLGAQIVGGMAHCATMPPITLCLVAALRISLTPLCHCTLKLCFLASNQHEQSCCDGNGLCHQSSREAQDL